MSTIETTLNNFFYAPILKEVFSKCPHEYRLTRKEIFRRKERPLCPSCHKPMAMNGYNPYTKKDLGSIKVGRWICKPCKESLEEDRTFWENMKDEFFGMLGHITSVLRKHHVSYQGMQDVFDVIYPRSRETIRLALSNHLEKVELPKVENAMFIHYDEQHPKQGRCQKFRLTLLDGESRNVIADELFDDKGPDTILSFLNQHLDPIKPVFIVTDFYSSYPKIFDAFFVNGCYHQKCLLHLNKLIGEEFPKNASISSLHIQYQLLDIFYDRTKEVEYLRELANESNVKIGMKGYKKWVKDARKRFYTFLHELELKRRREKKNLTLRTLEESYNRYDKIFDQYDKLSPLVQYRLFMIFKNWDNLTMFHKFENAPATNNAIENYYSTSLKTHHKRQYTSEKGIYQQIKLARMKRCGMLKYSGKTLMNILRMFIPFSRGVG